MNNSQGYEPPRKTRVYRSPTPKAKRFYEAEIKAKEQARQQAKEQARQQAKEQARQQANEQARQQEKAFRAWRKDFCGLGGNASYQQRRYVARK